MANSCVLNSSVAAVICTSSRALTATLSASHVALAAVIPSEKSICLLALLVAICGVGTFIVAKLWASTFLWRRVDV